MRKLFFFFVMILVLSACSFSKETDSGSGTSVIQDGTIPDFAHVVFIVFENENYNTVIGNSDMPTYNRMAEKNTLLTNYFAVTHPSLPNYIALVSGDTFKIETNCDHCFINASSIPDYIELSGRTWKTYQEDMPEPCFIGNNGGYVQHHNPFIYFDFIRLDSPRCERSVVPLTQLQTDIQANDLPNFIFITPNLCHNGHDCEWSVADAWLSEQLDALVPALDKIGQPYLIALIFDEMNKPRFFINWSDSSGGHIPVVLISPQIKKGFQDNTTYNHYSLLKTISDSWGLPYLGDVMETEVNPIVLPWK